MSQEPLDLDYVNTDVKLKIEQERTARWYAVLAAVVILLSVYMISFSFRMEIIPTGKHTGYLLNKWTGSVILIDFDTSTPITNVWQPPEEDLIVK